MTIEERIREKEKSLIEWKNHYYALGDINEDRDNYIVECMNNLIDEIQKLRKEIKS